MRVAICSDCRNTVAACVCRAPSFAFPRPTLADLDRRIAATLAELQQTNGEAYTELLGDLAAFRAMRAQVEQETT